MHVLNDIADIKGQTHNAILSQLPTSYQKRGFSNRKFLVVPAFIAVCSFTSITYGLLHEEKSVITLPSMEISLHAAAQEETSSSEPLTSAIQESSIASEFLNITEVNVPVSSLPMESAVSSIGIDIVPEFTAQQFQVLPLPAPPDIAPPLSKATHAFGVYLTATSTGREDFLNETGEDLVAAGGNALVIDVKGSAVFFEADTPMAKELNLVNKQYDLSEVLERAHERNIYVIGRFVALKDAGLARTKPDTLIAYPNTQKTIGYEFVDPENDDVLAYNGEVLCALAKSGIDEINLDYIRFSTAEVGELRVFSGVEKSRKVGVFVQMAREVIDRCGPKTKLGISTFAILGWNYLVNLETLGQDVIALAPIVDIISPMAYPATFSEAGSYYDPAKHGSSRNYHLVLRTLQGYQEFLGEHAWKLRPWIQGYGMLPKGMEDQMRAVSDAGLCGFTVWSAQNVYGNTLSAMKRWKQGEGC